MFIELFRFKMAAKTILPHYAIMLIYAYYANLCLLPGNDIFFSQKRCVCDIWAITKKSVNSFYKF